MDPFDTPAQAALDFFRLLIFGCSMVFIVLTIVGARDPRTRKLPTFPWITISMCLFAFVAGLSEITRLGHPFTWHIPFKVAAVVTALLASYKVGVYRSSPERWE